jgi:molecular chaperone DnaK (HSP70)
VSIAVGVAAALTLTSCGAPETADVDLSRLSEEVSEGVSSARDSLENLEGSMDDLNLDSETRAKVDEARTAASSAIDDARTAIEESVDSSAPEARQAVEDAKAGLADARTKLDDAAAGTEGAVKSALEALAEQIDRLSTQLDDAA